MKPREWEVTSQDVRYNGYEAKATLSDGWELFGVTWVPNRVGATGATIPQLRLWIRRPVKHKKKAPQRVIRIQSAGWGGHEVMLHLTQLWKPLSVDTSPGAADQAIIWFVKDAE